MLVSIDIIKCFIEKIGERYGFKKKSECKIERKILTEPSVNKVMETIMAGENDPSTQYPISHVTDEDGAIELFGHSLA